MAREIFPILKKSANEGSAPDEATEGTTAGAGLIGPVGFSFVKSTGEVTLVTLNSEGAVPVSSDPGTPFATAVGQLVGGSAAFAVVTDSEQTLAVDRVYNCLNVKGSSLRTTEYEIRQTDDVTETVIGRFVTGAGQLTFEWKSPKGPITAGGSGVQKIEVFARQANGTADVNTDVDLNLLPA